MSTFGAIVLIWCAWLIYETVKEIVLIINRRSAGRRLRYYCNEANRAGHAAAPKKGANSWG